MRQREINCSENSIYIYGGLSYGLTEATHIFQFTDQQPTIRVYEDGKLKREYFIETLSKNPNLEGQYLHSSISVLENGAVMMEGVVSTQKEYKSADANYEGIRFQPFFLSDAESQNEKLKGKGLIERGLHFQGKVTPANIRVICICDICCRSFTLQHFHAGFSDSQYFYSTDSSQTLIVPWYKIPGMPVQMQKIIDNETLEKVEDQLPKPSNGSGEYKYYNSFRCPHCGAAYIDFENNKESRPSEYYGNYLINQPLQQFINN